MTRNSATKFIFSLILSTALIYTLGQAVFGERGMMANRQLQIELEALQKSSEGNIDLISNLERTSNQVKSPEYITQIMNKIGYVQEEQTLYIMPHEKKGEGNEVSSIEIESIDTPLILSRRANFLISFSVSLLGNITFFWIKKRKRNKTDVQDY